MISRVGFVISDVALGGDRFTLSKAEFERVLDERHRGKFDEAYVIIGEPKDCKSIPVEFLEPRLAFKDWPHFKMQGPLMMLDASGPDIRHRK